MNTADSKLKILLNIMICTVAH